MKAKTIITKFLLLAFWIGISSGLIILLAAATKKQQQHICNNVLIKIDGNADLLHVDEAEIAALIYKAAATNIKGEAVTAINLSQLERGLKKHPWIKDAQLYFDTKNNLHVRVKERIPAARIFTTAGNSFFIDRDGHRMPVLDLVGIRLPVFTNFSASSKLSSKDSALLKDVVLLVDYTSNHSFWNSQVGQIDITPEGNFEMVPVIGDHIVKLGKADNIEEKFSNLFLFYQQVLSKTGFDKYKFIDIQYQNQVIGQYTTGSTAIDSVQLKKNIEQFVLQQQSLQEEVITQATEKPVFVTTASPVITEKKPDPVAVKNPIPNPAKAKSVPVKKPEKKEDKKEEKKPKAVMPARV
ncbi:MAG: FtsQ-type POTRA domain-containing protein [Flavisolibacter sp.]|nr:FtsQ-type POTRA domain-containing protein [Flavisolibacter sp.]